MVGITTAFTLDEKLSFSAPIVKFVILSSGGDVLPDNITNLSAVDVSSNFIFFTKFRDTNVAVAPGSMIALNTWLTPLLVTKTCAVASIVSDALLQTRAGFSFLSKCSSVLCFCPHALHAPHLHLSGVQLGCKQLKQHFLLAIAFFRWCGVILLKASQENVKCFPLHTTHSLELLLLIVGLFMHNEDG